MKVKFNFKMKGDEKNNLWADEATVTSLENAEEEIKTLIDVFNEDERSRHGKTASLREFAGLILPTALIEEIIEIFLDNVTCDHQGIRDEYPIAPMDDVTYSLEDKKEVMKKCLEAFLKEEKK